MAPPKKTSKQTTKTKKIKKIPEGRGIIHGKFSFNNTVLRLSKENGDALGKTISAGSIGFKNTKKATPYAAQKTAEEIIKMAAEYGINNFKLQVRGIGAGRDAVIKKILENESLKTEALIDKTPEKHGGCRPRKRPRK
jgi:small subunit ribosomal protein S11